MTIRIAVANSDFSVSLVDPRNKAIKPYQVANGEDLKILPGRVTGVVKLEGVPGEKSVAGYLVEIEGHVVFVDENLMEVSK